MSTDAPARAEAPARAGPPARSGPGIGAAVRWLLLTLIRGYQILISRHMPPICRFYPSCSRYTAEAIRLWGPWHGSWLGVKRICRCHPFHPGGLDPVPVPGAPDGGPEQTP
jgi:hypothetical protein